MASVYNQRPWPKSSLDQGWTRLLLSQHHDCWIVPYNMGQGNTWADKVVSWTGISNKNADSIMNFATTSLSMDVPTGKYIRIYNTLGVNRSEVVKTYIAPFMGKKLRVLDSKGKPVVSQLLAGDSVLLIRAVSVPSMGGATYSMVKQSPVVATGAKAFKQSDGKYKVETDLYTAVIDPAKGGTISSLVAKTLNNKEFVAKADARKFNELRGNFFKNGGFKSSADQPAEITILENGPLMVSVQIKGMVGNNPFTQVLEFTQGGKRIDVHLKIDWQGNPGIGDPYGQTGKYDAVSLKKAFYDDRDKLLALFPLNLKHQKVYKNAPFDVTESKLNNTFFNRWDSIKNNVVLNWVDVTDASNAYGMAVLTDHTTNYAHGEDFPLGLDIAYSGVGLWGRNYILKYPTEMNYALIPHAGKWDKAGIWTESTKFNEPLMAVAQYTAPTVAPNPASIKLSRSFISIAGTGLEISSVTMDGKDLLVRLFNAEGDSKPQTLSLDAAADNAEIVALNGDVVRPLSISKNATSATNVSVAMPRFGIRTIRFRNVRGK
jgi:alpha-mannosidase